MTDFRALCVELTDCLEKADWPHKYRVVFQQWTDISRAALAEQPVGPTDEELDKFAVFWWGSDTDERTVTDVIECCSMTAFARAVLARWGAPAAVPVPASERLPGAEDCDEQPVEPTDDSDLLQFLLDNFRSRSLHMDGTAYYVLDTGWPFNHRSSNSRAFVEQAYHKSCEHFRKQS